ncbi:MAG: tripartite tricarboxylate transporter substrate binding protein [Deltaproteobacteria bacterium]
MKTRHWVIFVVLVMLGIGIFPISASFAQRYPNRPIQLVIPNAAGGNMDIAARMLAGELEKIVGQKVIPSNKPGGATVLGADVVVRAKKDGYTLLYAGASSFIYAPITNPEIVHYDPAKDVDPLGFHFFFPQTITVRSDSPWKTFAELMDYAKKNPGKLRVSTTGIGSQPHFVLEMIQSMTGAQFTHVPFEGGESVITAVLGGHVEVTCDSLPKVRGHAEAGKLRILLMTNKMPDFPEIPTITELGYKQSLPTAWFGLYAPVGIPDEAKKILVPAIEKAVKITKPKMDQVGNICEYKSPSEQRKLRDEEYKQIYEMAVKIGLRKQ